MVRARSGVPLKRGRKRTRKLTKGFRQSRHNLYRSEEHTSELQSQSNLVCRLLLEKKKYPKKRRQATSLTLPLLYASTSFLCMSRVYQTVTFSAASHTAHSSSSHACNTIAYCYST